MKKLQLLPDAHSYAVQFGEGNISTKLDGGASRVRKDTVSNVHKITVNFSLNQTQYQYLMAFYRQITKRGALPFLMDLITDENTVKTHKVQIVPNTFTLSEQEGLRYVVSFTVEANPIEMNGELDNQLIANYESNKPLYNAPTEGWGNFFTPTELSETATNVQDGIYRINGDVVISLRDTRGYIYQTKYTRQGVETRYFDTAWTSWISLGGKRLLRTFTTVYDHKTGSVVKTFDGAGISGNLPNGEFDVVVTEQYVDGSQAEISRTRQVINMTAGSLTTIPNNYAILLQWSVPAKEGGYTEIWVSKNQNISDAKIVTIVDWPLDSYMYTGATQYQDYYFWVRPIDKRGIEGTFTGPVKGEVATPFEEDFKKMQAQLNQAIAETEAKTEESLNQLETDIKAIVSKTNADLSSALLQRVEGIDAKLIEETQARITGIAQLAATEARLRSEAMQEESNARTRALQAEAASRTAAIKVASDAAAANLLAKSNELGTRITNVETINTNQASQISTLTASQGATAAALEVEKKARADGDKAEATARGTLAARVANTEGAINEEKRVRAEADLAQAEKTSQLTSRVAGAEGNITKLQKTVADNEQARVDESNAITAKFNNLSTGARNLLRDSNKSVNSSNYLNRYRLTEAPNVGEEVTVTLWGRLGEDRTDFAVYNSVGHTELAKLQKISDGIYRATFAWKHPTRPGTGEWATDTHLNVYAYPSNGTSVNIITKIKLERGNIASDWTRAPEELETKATETEAALNEFKSAQATKDQAVANELRDAKSRIGQNESKITNLQTTKAGKTEVVGLVRQDLQSEWQGFANQAKEQAVAAAQADATAKANAAKQAAEAAAHSKADAAKAAAIAAASGDATSKANAAKAQAIADAAEKDAVIKQQAASDAQLKATRAKDEAIAEAQKLNNATNAAITSLQKTVADNDSARAQESRELTARFDGLAVGGRNYILKSGGSWEGYNPNVKQSFSVNNEDLLQKGFTHLTISVDVEIEGNTNTTYSTSNRAGLRTRVIYTDESIAWFEAWDNSASIKKRIFKTLAIPSDKAVQRIDMVAVQTRLQNVSKVKVSNPKLEIGNVPTDWSPAPEDTSEKADATEASLKEYKSAQALAASAEALRLTQALSRVDNAESEIRNLKQTTVTRDTATSIATSEVNSRFQIKDTRNNNERPTWYWTNYPRQTVNELKVLTAMGLPNQGSFAVVTTEVPWIHIGGGKIVQTAVLDNGKTYKRLSNTAHTYANGAYTYSRDEWGAWVEQETAEGAQAKADAVKQIAEAANALATRTDADFKQFVQTTTTATSATAEKLEQMSAKLGAIGNRNLFRATAQMTNTNYWRFSKSASQTNAEHTRQDELLTLSVANNAYAAYIQRELENPLLAFKGGEVLTISLDVRCTTSTNNSVKLRVREYLTDGRRNSVAQQTKQTKVATVGKWERIDWTFTLTGKHDAHRNWEFWVEHQATNSTMEIKNIKLEYGHIATPWREATEDIVDGVKSDINKVEADYQSYKVTQADKDNATSKTVSTLATTVQGHTTKISETAESVNGLKAEKTVAIDNNGYVTGYKLLSDASGGTPRGNFVVTADKFQVASGNNTKITPFTIDSANRTIAIDGRLVVNGEAIISKLNAGVIDGAKIKAGTIRSNHIATGSITADKIGAGQITADKIASKAITADHINASTLSAISANLGEINAGHLNLGNGKFVVDWGGNVYMRSDATRNVGLQINPQHISIYNEHGVEVVRLGLL